MELKPVNFIASIDTSIVTKDLQSWDNQSGILQNTGIERDGGITNLYATLESNSIYAETYYGKNGTRISLLRDEINDNYRVVTGGRDVGQVPPWASESRRVLSVDANDVLTTINDTFLVLRISSGSALIEEVNKTTFERIQARSFSIPANISDGMFVRNKAPTYANVTSIVGIFQTGSTLNHQIIRDSGVTYTATGQTGFQNSSQVFAYFENGWIVGAQEEISAQVFLFRSTGAQEGTFTRATYITANGDTTAVTFNAWRDVVRWGAPVTTYGYSFIPPAAPGGAWTVTAITNGSISSPVSCRMTFGGYELIYGASRIMFYSDQDGTFTYTVGHTALSEIYGYLNTEAEIAFKTHTILGEAGYVSASFARDGIGVPITEIGELSAYYYPQIIKCSTNDYCIVYRRGNGSFGFVELTKTPTNPRMQEISPGVVKINTISALCIADANDNDLQYSGNAYNGFIVVGFSGGTSTAKAYVARYRGDFGGSVDTGYKDCGSVPDVSLVFIPEGRSYSANNETIDVYIGPPPASLAYYRSVRDGLAQSIKGNLQGTLYIDDTILPPPIGVTYGEQTIALIGSTAIREFNYDGYALGNETPGVYVSFRLYGNLYLFDGDWIHLATLSAGNVLQGVTHIANALGLVFLAESPQAVFFLSTFDNSLYTFDGGQAVQKIMRFNRKEPIRGAVYNTRENTLAIFADDYVMWMRDSIVTQVPLPFVWPYVAFSTSDGIWLAKDKYTIRYLYNPVALSGGGISMELDGGTWGTVYADIYDGGTWGTVYADTYEGVTFGSESGQVVPLTWQSKFNGYTERTRQALDRYIFRVYQETSTQVDIVVRYDYFTEEGAAFETQTITVGDSTNPYDGDGYAYFEFVPSQKQSIGASVTLTCEDKIVYLDGMVSISPAAETVVKNRK